MKKILLFTIILAFIFTACGKKNEVKKEDEKKKLPPAMFLKI